MYESILANVKANKGIILPSSIRWLRDFKV